MQLGIERLYTFAQASDELRRKGITRSIAIQTLHRWRAKGGLEAVRVGGTWYTSLEAFDRFVTRRSGRKNESKVDVNSASDKANKSLADSGW